MTSADTTVILSVYALRDRGLVAAPRRSGAWTAEITDAGRHYLSHGIHPDHPSLHPKGGGQVRERPTEPIAEVEAVTRPPAPTISTDDVLRVLAEKPRNFGRIFTRSEIEKAGWLHAVREVRSRRLVPPGKHIRYSNDGVGGIRIWLADGEDPNELRRRQDHSQISVPERVARLHPAVAAMKTGGNLLVSKNCRSRALRILHTLATEAERRGHSVTSTVSEHSPGSLIIGIGTHTYPVGIHEEADRVPHQPKVYELQQKKRNSWFKIPEWDSIPSGRLMVELPSTGKTNRYRWADRKRGTLEEQLPDVLAEIEARAITDERRRIAAEREAVVRQREWESAMAVARGAHLEHRRAAVLEERAQALEKFDQLHRYCERLEEAIAANRELEDAEAVVAAEAWLDWVKARIHSINPLRMLPALPPDPEPAPNELQPFLKGWSAHGPDCYGSRSRPFG